MASPALSFCQQCPCCFPYQCPVTASDCSVSRVMNQINGSLDSISRFIANLKGRPVVNPGPRCPNNPLASNAVAKVGNFTITTGFMLMAGAILIVLIWVARK